MAELIGDGEMAPGHRAGGGASRLTAGEWLLLLVLAAVQFTHIVDFMIIMPLGPVYMREMGLSTEQFSSVIAAYTVSAGLAGLLAARFLDRFDRKTALLTLYAGFTVGTFLCAVAPSFYPLLAARAVTGAFGGLAAAVVLAVIGDAFPEDRRGTATGVVMSAFSVASIAGVPMGLQVADMFSWHYPFVALGGLGAANFALGYLVLPPLRGHLGRRPARSGALWHVLTDANHMRAYTLMVALVMSTFMIFPLLATYLVFNVGLEQSELKFMYVCGGLATLFTMTPIGRLSDRYGKLPVFRVMAVATLILIEAMTNLPAGLHLSLVLVVTTVFMVVSSGRMVPAMAMITSSAAPRFRGSFMSLNTAVQHLSSGVATAIAGLLIHKQESGALTGFPLVGLLACIATVASLFLAGRLRPSLGGGLAPDSELVHPHERGGSESRVKRCATANAEGS